MVTKNEMEERVKAVFNPGRNYRDYTIELWFTNDNRDLTIRLKQMYEYVDVQFDHLSQLSEVFATRKIDIGDKSAYGGCETCDHGSSYELSIHVRDIGLEIT